MLYHQVFFGNTNDWIDEQTINDAGGRDEIRSAVALQVWGELHRAVERAFIDKGKTVDIIRVRDVRVNWEENAIGQLRLRWSGITEYESDEQFFESPIDPITATFLIYVAKIVVTGVVVAVIAYLAIQAIERWLTSMTTRTTTIRQYDEFGNLIYEETITEPDPTGIAIIIAGVCACIATAIIVMGKKPR